MKCSTGRGEDNTEPAQQRRGLLFREDSARKRVKGESKAKKRGTICVESQGDTIASNRPTRERRGAENQGQNERPNENGPFRSPVVLKKRENRKIGKPTLRKTR